MNVEHIDDLLERVWQEVFIAIVINKSGSATPRDVATEAGMMADAACHEIKRRKSA